MLFILFLDCSTLYASVFYLILHRSVMTSPETFWDLYEPLLTAAASIEVINFNATYCILSNITYDVI